MDLYDLFNNYRELLTDNARRFIETSDQESIKDLGTFSSVEEFNEFVENNMIIE